jgi:aminoglycoside/choline kinase family phosphotransferase
MLERQEQLLEWVNSSPALKGEIVSALEIVSGDASFRRYYRVVLSNQNLIAVDAPPERENNRQFVQIRNMLHQNGLRVPHIYAVDYEEGFMIVSDLGDLSYYRQIGDPRLVEPLYRGAVESLIELQKIDAAQWDLPLYDEAFIARELAIFTDWFIGSLLGKSLLGENNYGDFGSIVESLISSAIEQPSAVMHRDYHSRNLMDIGQENPGILDFQDAVLGPISYDLVSLLKDCYVQWPDEFVEHWISRYLETANSEVLMNQVNRQQFTRWFDLMGLQRHLKCLGIFSRLYKRDNKSGYLIDIPRVLDYVLVVTNKYPEFTRFHDWLAEDVRPAVYSLTEFRDLEK